MRLLATYTKEQNICIDTVRLSLTETQCLARQNVVGQTGGLYTGGGIFSNYTATPDWSGNLYGTYRKGPFTVTAQARYTGAGKISVGWVGPDDPRYGPERYATMSENLLPSCERPKYVGRSASASPATGSYSIHQKEQAELVTEALKV